MSAANINLPTLERTTGCVDKFAHPCAGPKPKTRWEYFFSDRALAAVVLMAALHALTFSIARDIEAIRDGYRAIRCDDQSASSPTEVWRTARSEAR